MSMTLVSRVIVSVSLTELTMATIESEMRYSVEAGFSRTIHFGAFSVVMAGLSRARLWHLGTFDSCGNADIAALCLINMAHFRSHRDDSSELTCRGR